VAMIFLEISRYVPGKLKKNSSNLIGFRTGYLPLHHPHPLAKYYMVRQLFRYVGELGCSVNVCATQKSLLSDSRKVKAFRHWSLEVVEARRGDGEDEHVCLLWT